MGSDIRIVAAKCGFKPALARDLGGDILPGFLTEIARHMQFVHHPDRGGDPERFREVQALAEELKETISDRSCVASLNQVTALEGQVAANRSEHDKLRLAIENRADVFLSYIGGMAGVSSEPSIFMERPYTLELVDTIAMRLQIMPQYLPDGKGELVPTGIPLVDTQDSEQNFEQYPKLVKVHPSGLVEITSTAGTTAYEHKLVIGSNRSMHLPALLALTAREATQDELDMAREIVRGSQGHKPGQISPTSALPMLRRMVPDFITLGYLISYNHPPGAMPYFELEGEIRRVKGEGS
ncbi:MAG: hypothetical protein DCC75_05425 [Proteobacteria bacterium]|nr:MAG: hypothetical protein DCC75_05425 [Pseudomonadota bacterium]